MSLLPEECGFESVIGKLPDIRFIASPSASDIENSHAILLHESVQHQGRAFIARRALHWVSLRFTVLLSESRCAFAAAGQRWRDGKNNSGIRVPDIPLGPLEVARGRRFVKRVGQ